MMTPTHLLIAGAVLSKSGSDKSSDSKTSYDVGNYWVFNLAVIIGALLPDFSIYILFVWAKFFAQISSHELWTSVYWQEPWQTFSAISNSVPLYVGLLVVGLVFKVRWLLFLCGAALLHVLFDLPFHHADAHQHFWPITEFRFHSPLSYWNRDHYGDVVSIGECVLALICIVFLWRRFESLLLKISLILAAASYGLIPLYFWWSLS
ncbi:MAG: hypothetical protein JJ964_01590 [Rhizobiales bacterium]|nr:hypothetical protein [Hyphomicrobiales bacterium]